MTFIEQGNFSNYDVLSMVPKLSDQEVATPVGVANACLDLLPEEVWSDPSLRWLDPGSKTGVFPREITRRLMAGLEGAIPDPRERLRHILNGMVFAIAVTELNALMSRRTLYNAKDASSELSVVRFASRDGNVWQKKVEHLFNDKGTCTECKGTRGELEVDGRDNKAYGLIHADGRAKIDKEMTMKFDVIVGNPPYQMPGGGGGTNDTPLYNVFVDEAVKLKPRYISMIIPSRWMAGGRGLNDFRSRMLGDRRMRVLADYPNAWDLFPGVEIQSGVCYFLWDRDHPGLCSTTIARGNERFGPVDRQLDEFDVFVRDERALKILRKVLTKGETSVMELVSGDTPYGLPTNFKGYRKGEKKRGDVKLHIIEDQKRTEKWIPLDAVTKNISLIRPWKVYVPKAYNGGPHLPHRIIGPSFVGGQNSVCTQSFLAVGPFDTKAAAESFQSYIETRFFRFLLSLRKISQDAMKGTYAWVPQQEWNCAWTDAELYKKYDITADEHAYIETMVKA